MRIYVFPVAPNPTRVRLYLGEKGIELEQVLVNLPKGEQRSPAHLARNPLGKLPVLELDDGTWLTESLAIMEYLEELHPEPPMLGRTPLERARARALERIADLGGSTPWRVSSTRRVRRSGSRRCRRSRRRRGPRSPPRSRCSRTGWATRPSWAASARPSPTARSLRRSASGASAASRSTRDSPASTAGTPASRHGRARSPRRGSPA